ncbi:MAG: hypothetical protein ACOH1V_10105 [Stenotrophomonas sp.]
MTQRSVFQLMDGHRKVLTEEHCFYVEEAKKRLLSQFDNISEEAEQAQEQHWNNPVRDFDPDFHDMGDVAQDALDHGVQFFQLLSEMRDRTRFSVIAGMYHHWDKAWRKFLAHELRWTIVIGEHTRRAIFSLDAKDLDKLLLALGLEVRSFPDFERLDAMRLIVNVYKHAEGSSLEGSPPLSRTLTRRPMEVLRSVHVEAKEVQRRVQARCG